MVITASIVLYNNEPQELLEAIESCLSTPLIRTLFLIDNSVTDQLRRVLKDERCVYIYNNSNIGFGAAHNIVLRQILGKSHYHLVLNPDIKFGKGVIEALSIFMEAEPNIGLVMPKVLYKDGTIQRLCKLLPTPMDLIGRRFLSGTGWARKAKHRYELESFNYDEMMDIPNLSGCFMFIRTSVLEKTGCFDERYLLYLEDVDLVRRIGQISRTVFYPYVEVFHGYQKASYNTKKIMFIHMRSAIQYFNKWGWLFDRQRSRSNEAILERLSQISKKDS